MIDEMRITQAVEKAKKLSWTIQPGVSLDRIEKCCCPFGALFIDSPIISSNILDMAASLLQITIEEVKSFATGFDDEEEDQYLARWTSYIEAYHLGRKFRKCLESTLPSS